MMNGTSKPDHGVY